MSRSILWIGSYCAFVAALAAYVLLEDDPLAGGIFLLYFASLPGSFVIRKAAIALHLITVPALYFLPLAIAINIAIVSAFLRALKNIKRTTSNE